MKFKGLDQLKMGALISYFALAFNIVAGIIYTPWMVSKIGQSNYGLYTLANSLIAIFMLDFGLGSAVSRYVSKYRAEGRYNDINNILGVIYKLYIIIDAVILAVLCVVYFFLGSIYKELTPDELEQFRILYIIVAGYNLIAFPLSPLNGILNAFEKFIQLKICDLLLKVFAIVAVVIVLCFSSSVTVVILATVISNTLVLLIKYIFAKTGVPVRVNLKASGKQLYKTLFSFTAWTTVISIMQRFTHSFAPSILGITSGAIEIAIYAPAVTLEGYFYTIGMAINGLFLPRVSRYIANNEENKILQLMIKIGRYQSIVLGLVFIGFVCVGKEFMVLWMGPDYEKTYYLAMVILFPTLVSSTQQIANTTVIAKKLIKYQAKCMVITGFIGLAISYLLSLQIGALGVCIGTAVTSLCNTVYMNTVYKRKAGINVFEFYKKCYLRLIPCYVVIIVLSLIFTNYITLAGWTGLLVKGAGVCLIFAVVMALFYITKQEKSVIINRVKSMVRR